MFLINFSNKVSINIFLKMKDLKYKWILLKIYSFFTKKLNGKELITNYERYIS